MSDTATERLLKCKREAYMYFDKAFDRTPDVYEDPTLIKMKQFGFYAWVEKDLGGVEKATSIEFDMDDEMFQLLKADGYLLYKEMAKDIKFNLSNRGTHKLSDGLNEMLDRVFESPGEL